MATSYNHGTIRPWEPMIGVSAIYSLLSTDTDQTALSSSHNPRKSLKIFQPMQCKKDDAITGRSYYLGRYTYFTCADKSIYHRNPSIHPSISTKETRRLQPIFRPRFLRAFTRVSNSPLLPIKASVPPTHEKFRPEYLRRHAEPTYAQTLQAA